MATFEDKGIDINELKLYLRFDFFFLPFSTGHGMDSRPAMAIFELLDYIVNEVHIPLHIKHLSRTQTQLSSLCLCSSAATS